jgi:hypothetical protein
MKKLWPLAGLFLCLPVFADTINLSWTPSDTRENGTQVTGETTFEVYQNSELVYSGKEESFTTEIQGSAIIEVYQLEDGIKSKPAVRYITIEKYPPNRPVLK